MDETPPADSLGDRKKSRPVSSQRLAAAEAMHYVPALDGLRAVAVALVLVAHGAKPLEWPGGFGVDIFFVLSGFLITGILWREQQETGRIRLRRFFLKRLIRLSPALVTMLFVSLLLGLATGKGIIRPAIETLAALLYLTPLTDALIGQSIFYGHLWSLAGEEYFYLLWPVALIVLRRVGFSWRFVVGLCFLGAAVLYGLRTFLALVGDAELSLPRVGGIAIGCAIALIWQHRVRVAGSAVLVAAGVIGLLAAWLTSGTQFDAATPILGSVATAALILAFVAPGSSPIQRVLECGPMVAVGRISYELYLWHVPVLIGASMVLDVPRNHVWWWAYAVASLMAAVTHYGFAPWQARARRAVRRRFG